MKIARRTCLLAALLMAAVCGPGCGGDEDDAKGVVLVEYGQLKAMMDDGEDLVVIDVRLPDEYAAGHLPDAVNIELRALVAEDGSLVDGGKVLLDAVADKGTRIMAYCFGYGNDKDFADAALELGYANVYRYSWGTNDWVAHDYLVIEYSAFKKWHDAKHPFDDENYLFDVLPEAWYTGDDPDHPGGHIPGAIGLPVELWGDASGPVDDGKAFTDLVVDKGAKVVIYCGNPVCGKSHVGAATAVQLGYTNVFRYPGGWQEWQDEGNALKPGLVP